MTEDFVTIDIAQKLKTKGFPQGNEDDITRLYYQISDNLQSAIMRSEGKDIKWYCPTISEVMKWLRNEKKLYILLTDVPIMGNIKWDFEIDDINTSDIIYESRLIYNSYEEAAMAGIEWVLNNLI